MMRRKEVHGQARKCRVWFDLIQHDGTTSTYTLTTLWKSPLLTRLPMYLPPALLLLVSAQVASIAYAFAPYRSMTDAAGRIHTFAKRHSTRFARDVRVVFQELAFNQKQLDPNASGRVYCVRPSDLQAGLGDNSTLTSPATRTSYPSSGSVTSSVATPTATSPWKLVESHVSTGRLK